MVFVGSSVASDDFSFSFDKLWPYTVIIFQNYFQLKNCVSKYVKGYAKCVGFLDEHWFRSKYLDKAGGWPSMGGEKGGLFEETVFASLRVTK